MIAASFASVYWHKNSKTQIQNLIKLVKQLVLNYIFPIPDFSHKAWNAIFSAFKWQYYDSWDETILNFFKELKIEIWEQPPNWKHPRALKTKAETEAMKSFFAVGF